MVQNTFPDGFPNDPIQAIDFCYFLSGSEKTEWKQWLSEPGREQSEINEFLETIHNLWIEHQKNATPDNFSNNNQGEKTQQTQTQNFQTKPEPAPYPAINNQNKPPNPFADVRPEPKKEEKTPDQIQEDSVKSFGKSGYTPNPLINDTNPFASNSNNKTKSVKPKPAPSPKPKSEPNPQRKPEPKVKPKPQPNPEPQRKPEPKKPATPFRRIKDSGIRNKLEDIYQEYLGSKDRKFASEREYLENHSKFLEKVMNIYGNFEELLESFDEIAQKVVLMNDKIVKQAEDLNEKESEIYSRIDDLQIELTDIKSENESLTKELRRFRGEANQKFKQSQTAIEKYGADSFGKEGFSYKMDKVWNEVEKIKKDLTNNQKQISPTNIIEENQSESIREKLQKLSIPKTETFRERKKIEPYATQAPKPQAQNRKPTSPRNFWDTGKAENQRQPEIQQPQQTPGTIDLRGII